MKSILSKKIRVNRLGKKKKKNKKNHNEIEVMTEEEYFGFDFIAGFTSGGVPFGITSEEADENEKEMDRIQVNEEIDLPF